MLIPGYCWPIIDSKEFQRLRNIAQLGPCNMVYPGANHTRFEHSLGTCHLAHTFMSRIQATQPELGLEPRHRQSVVLAALCHDLGLGPFSHTFLAVARSIDARWDPLVMSTRVFRRIVAQCDSPIDADVVDAACDFIIGREHDSFPRWLCQVACNRATGIDLCKLDYLSRDVNRTLTTTKFEYDRLIVNCRVLDDELSWKVSEIPTIEYFFYNLNDMFLKVYYHRVVQALEFMIHDIFDIISDEIDLGNAIDDPAEFVRLDDRILLKVEHGTYGERAQQLALDMKLRKLYRFIGEIRVSPKNGPAGEYSQRPSQALAEDICRTTGKFDASVIRVLLIRYRYGLSTTNNPILAVPFWRTGDNKAFRLTNDDVCLICTPSHFLETAIRVFAVDERYVNVVNEAFQLWKENGIFSAHRQAPS
jgi:HD superfamily phosphohydrolase